MTPDDDLDAALRDFGQAVVKELHLEYLLAWLNRQVQRWPWLYRKLS